MPIRFKQMTLPAVVVWIFLQSAAGLFAMDLPGLDSPLRVRLQPGEVVAGGVLLFELEPAAPAGEMPEVRAFFGKTPVTVFKHPDPNSKLRYGMVGIPMEAEPGENRLDVAWEEAGSVRRIHVPFRILKGRYRTVTLQVDPRKVSLSKEDRQRVEREHRKLMMIYATGTENRNWQGPFQLPISSAVTSSFGTRRVFNGLVQSYHSGVDLRASAGEPIFASNAGVVRLASELFYSGNAVVIDHGTGIFTSYSHLSRLDVHPDQVMKKGQQLGLSGATGRVSGPHLHWGVRINAVRVDPMAFMQAIDALLGVGKK